MYIYQTVGAHLGPQSGIMEKDYLAYSHLWSQSYIQFSCKDVYRRFDLIKLNTRLHLLCHLGKHGN